MRLETDTYYIERTLDGETEYFSFLLDKYNHLVFSLIYKMAKNREDAEELTQDVFVKAFRNLNKFKGDSNFSTWLYRIAYNTAVSEMRKKRPTFVVIEEELITHISEEDSVAVLVAEKREENIKHLEKALTLLPAEDNALIHLFYLQNKTIEEVAKIAGLSVPNIKTRLHRIRKKLYVLLTNMKKKD